MTRRRVVITGLGTVNPLALNVPDYWRGLLAGRSGIAPITRFDTTDFKVKFGGEVKGFSPEPVLDTRSARKLDRFTQFAVVAAAEAVADSGLDFATENAFRHHWSDACGEVERLARRASSRLHPGEDCRIADDGNPSYLRIDPSVLAGKDGLSTAYKWPVPPFPGS